MRKLVPALTPIVLVAALAGPISAQSPAAPAAPLVRTHAVALNGDDRFLTNLPRAAFSVIEDGQARPIETFETNAPASVVFVLDTSGSMRAVTNHDPKALFAVVSRAIATFAARRTAPTEYALVTFRERPKLAVDYTSDAAAVAAAVEGLPELYGESSLFDAYAFAVAQAKRSTRPKQAIVIFSDGMDTKRDGASKEVRRLRDSTDAVIFTVRLIRRPTPTPEQFPSHSPYVPPSSDAALSDLATPTGGAYYEAGTDQDLVDAFDWVADQLNHEYTIGFRASAGAAKDDYRKVTVRLADDYARQPAAKGLRIRARQGYLPGGA